MTTEERRALLDRAITTYGAPAQMDMAVEEMADVQIMLDQHRLHRRHRHHGVYQQARHGVQRGGRSDH